MPDYQKLYYSLFNDVTDIITQLQKAQQRAEELYIESCETPVFPFESMKKPG